MTESDRRDPDAGAPGERRALLPRRVSRTALMEPPMFGFMEPLTGADLWSRTG